MPTRTEKFFQLVMIFLSIVQLNACLDPDTPGGEITIRNDILDKEYNSFVVDQVMNESGITAFRRTLHPNEQVVIPFKNISSLRFTRKYQDFSRIYLVDCPKGFHKKITMKLIDVHSNRLGGGCALTKRGEQRGGLVTWEKQ